jgi:hypothetical protein
VAEVGLGARTGFVLEVLEQARTSEAPRETIA